MPVFANENQQDRLVTSSDRENRVLQKIEFLARKLKCLKFDKKSVNFMYFRPVVNEFDLFSRLDEKSIKNYIQEF